MDNKRKETEDYYEEQSKKYKNPRTHDPLLPHELHLPFPTFGMPPPERTDVDRQSYGYYNNGPPPPRYHPYPEMPPQYYKPPPVQQNYQDHYYEPSVCNLCGRIAVDPDRILIPTSLCFHRACYFDMMSRGPSFYQSVAAPPHMASPPPISEVIPAEPIEISVNNNPEKFQIANYNLFPTPSLVVEKANTVNRQVTAYLVENMKHNVIEKGFRAGETALIRAGAKTVIFTGLKLNKMGHLKSELQKFNLRYLDDLDDRELINRPKDVSFYIQFVIGSTVVKSDTFRIVSSFSQLTSDEQDKRPSSSKKTSQNTESSSPPQKSISNERIDNKEQNRDEMSNVNKRVD